MTYHLPVLPPELTGPPEGWAPKEGFSPSALASYAGADGCKRRWAWGALFGVWSLKKSIATLLGSLIHGSLEHYLRGGTVYDLVGPNGEIRLDARTWKEFEIMLQRGWLSKERLAELAATAPTRALAGINFLPNIKDPNIEVIETEQWVNIDTTRVLGGVERIKINAKIDLRMKRVGVWYLYDHKSTKGKPRDPWCYIKTPEQLMKDPQAVFYALDLILRHNLDGLWIRWVYYLTDPQAHPLAKAVDVEFSREQVMAAAYEWLLVAHEMRGLVRAAKTGNLSPDDVPANLDACPTYGGCTYHYSKGGPCQPEGEVKLGDLILAGGKPEKAIDMALADKLAETKSKLTNGSGQAPLIPPLPFVPPEAQAAVTTHAVPAAVITPAATAQPALPPGWHYHNNLPRADAQPGFYYDASGAQVPIPQTTIAPSAVAVVADVAEQMETAVAEGTKRRGRPKGAKNAPKVEAGETNNDIDEDLSDRVMGVILQAANRPTAPDALRSLTIAQFLAIRQVLENELP